MGLQTVGALCTYAALLESEKRKGGHLVALVIFTSGANYAQYLHFGQPSLLSLRPGAVCMSILSILSILGLVSLQAPKNCSAGLNGW